MFTSLKKLFAKLQTKTGKPEPMDVYKLADKYFNANADEREAIRNSFTEQTSWDLLLKSETLAAEAVRKNNYDLVKKGLILHSIENSRTDWRDNLVRFSLLYHSGKKLNEDPNVLFKEIADISQTRMQDLLLGFIKRKEKDKSISVMGYKEINDPDFNYKRTFE